MAPPYTVTQRLDIPDEAFDPDGVVHLFALSRLIEQKGTQRWKVDIVPSLDPDAPVFGSISVKGPLEYVASALTAAQVWVQKECDKNGWRMRIFSIGTKDHRAPDREPSTTASATISR